MREGGPPYLPNKANLDPLAQPEKRRASSRKSALTHGKIPMESGALGWQKEKKRRHRHRRHARQRRGVVSEKHSKQESSGFPVLNGMKLPPWLEEEEEIPSPLKNKEEEEEPQPPEILTHLGPPQAEYGENSLFPLLLLEEEEEEKEKEEDKEGDDRSCEEHGLEAVEGLRILERVEQHADVFIFNSASMLGGQSSKMKKLLAEDKVPPLQQLLGLHSAKRLLQRDILTPLRNPQLYRSPFRSPHMLCIYGREGSGKRSLALSFCRTHSINAIVVSRFYDGEGWIGTLIQAACAIKPCVILFDSCDHHFSSGNNSGTSWSRQSLYFMELLLLREELQQQVWLLLCSSSIPMLMHAEINRCVSDYSAYAEPPSSEEDKTRMFMRVFEDGWGRGRWLGDLYGRFMGKVLTDYSEAVNFKDLYDFAERLYRARVEELDEETLAQVRMGDERLMPSEESLQKELQEMTRTKRITRQDVVAAHDHYLQQEGRSG